jgi:hypothetical protein
MIWGHSWRCSESQYSLIHRPKRLSEYIIDHSELNKVQVGLETLKSQGRWRRAVGNSDDALSITGFDAQVRKVLDVFNVNHFSFMSRGRLVTSAYSWRTSSRFVL